MGLELGDLGYPPLFLVNCANLVILLLEPFWTLFSHLQSEKSLLAPPSFKVRD